MSAYSLLPPPADFNQLRLEIAAIQPAKLVRISRFPDKEPYFGRSGGNRFDCPPPVYFGTAYFGETLAVAIAESVLHDEVPIKGQFRVAISELQIRNVLRFKRSLPQPLRLARLIGTSLKRLGGHGEISGTAHYNITQSWAGAVFSHPQEVDGFIYMSRHLNDSYAFVLFDRARHKLALVHSTRLIDHPEFAAAARKLGIRPF